MDHVYSTVEGLRLAEEYPLGAWLELFEHPFYALEEHGLHLSGAVSDPHAEPLARLFVQLDAHHPASQLDVCHVRPGVCDVYKAALVDVSERVYPKQLAHGTCAELLMQQLRSFGADSRQILYVHF